MKQVLKATETTGEVFDSRTPFTVSMDIFAEGWFLEFGRNQKNPANINWKRYHDVALREHGELSRVVVLGSRWNVSPDIVYRMNGGTVGGTAYMSQVDISVFS